MHAKKVIRYNIVVDQKVMNVSIHMRKKKKKRTKFKISCQTGLTFSFEILAQVSNVNELKRLSVAFWPIFFVFFFTGS